jgi:hypothetical protein
LGTKEVIEITLTCDLMAESSTIGKESRWSPDGSGLTSLKCCKCDHEQPVDPPHVDLVDP